MSLVSSVFSLKMPNTPMYCKHVFTTLRQWWTTFLPLWAETDCDFCCRPHIHNNTHNIHIFFLFNFQFNFFPCGEPDEPHKNCSRNDHYAWTDPNSHTGIKRQWVKNNFHNKVLFHKIRVKYIKSVCTQHWLKSRWFRVIFVIHRCSLDIFDIL